GRHFDVEENHVKRVLVQHDECCKPVRSADRIVIGAFEGHFICPVGYLVVVHQENPVFAGGFSRPSVPAGEQVLQTFHCLNQGLNRGGRHSTIRPQHLVE